MATTEIRYLQERARMGAAGEKLETLRRRAPWSAEIPTYVDPTPGAVLRDYVRARGTVLVTGDPWPGGMVARTCADADEMYTDTHTPSVRYGRGRVGFAAAWWGERVNATQARRCHEWLNDRLRVWWEDRHAGIVGTPATTGRDLFLRSLAKDESWPVMSPEAQHTVRGTGGQGRMEMFPAAVKTIPALHEYDARMAYADLVRSLPVGNPDALLGAAAARHWRDNPYSGGRYLVEWEAPTGWDRPGILPAHTTGDDLRSWCWPTEGVGWCGSAELFVAQSWGWRYRLLGGLVWRRSGDPMRRWRDRLLRVLASSQRNEQLSDVERAAIRHAVRAMILHTIGAFHGAERRITRTGPAADMPEGAVRVQHLGGDRWSWTEYTRPAWPEAIHPEWTVTVWSRARARLLDGHNGRTGALHCRPGTVVALRTDAVYTTEATGWESYDGGQVGRYRHRVYGGGRWPANAGELLAMRANGGDQ